MVLGITTGSLSVTGDNTEAILLLLSALPVVVTVGWLITPGGRVFEPPDESHALLLILRLLLVGPALAATVFADILGSKWLEPLSRVR